MSINTYIIEAAADSGELESWPMMHNGMHHGIGCGGIQCHKCHIGVDIGVQSDDLNNEDCSRVICPFCKSRCVYAGTTPDDVRRNHRGRGILKMGCGTELYICSTRMTAYQIGNGCSGSAECDMI